MGKKKSSRTNAAAAAEAPPKAASAFVLKVPTHCRCDGCGDKVRSAVKDLTLRCEGILSLDQSALATMGELAVVATADPEKLRRRLRKATGKDVRLVFPKPAKPAAADAKDAAADLVSLLAGLQLQQQQHPVHVHHGHPMPAAASAWNALPHGGYGQPAYHHPWVLQQQQQQVALPEPYLASYPAAAAYPHEHDGLGGAYGGGGGWFRF